MHIDYMHLSPDMYRELQARVYNSIKRVDPVGNVHGIFDRVSMVLTMEKRVAERYEFRMIDPKPSRLFKAAQKYLRLYSASYWRMLFLDPHVGGILQHGGARFFNSSIVYKHAIFDVFVVQEPPVGSDGLTRYWSTDYCPITPIIAIANNKKEDKVENLGDKG